MTAQRCVDCGAAASEPLCGFHYGRRLNTALIGVRQEYRAYRLGWTERMRALRQISHEGMLGSGDGVGRRTVRGFHY